MYLQKNVIGGFSSNYFWSSSETGASNAWIQDFGNGNQYSSGVKSSISYVRAIRDF